MDGLSSKGLWAVGQNGIVHWSGARWVSGYYLEQSDPYGVSAASADNVWVTGVGLIGSTYKTIVLSWNGNRWTKSDVGVVNAAGSDVSAVSSDDVWIVG